MRCSQPQGLPTEASQFLEANVRRVNECRHCHRHNGNTREIIGQYGMFDELNLYRYSLLDSTTAEEYIQKEIWDSGPIIWLALKWKDITFKWREGEMII